LVQSIGTMENENKLQ